MRNLSMSNPNVAWMSGLIFLFTAMAVHSVAAQPPLINSSVKVAQGTTDIAQRIQRFTVQVIADRSRSSGTLLAQKGTTFLVLTNLSVVKGTQSLQIRTFDGQVYKAKVLNNPFETNINLALLEFTSSKSYEVPEISQVSPQVGWSLVSSGFSTIKGKFQVNNGKLQQVPSKSSKNVGLVYSNAIEQGMEGGPIFEDSDEKLVGISGVSRTNEGVSIQQVLAEVNSEIVTAYHLPPASLNSPDFQVLELTEELLATMHQIPGEGIGEWFNGKWSQEIKPKTKQVTVRIDSDRKGNGSGVIIAKNANIYTVLTASHVVCKNINTSGCQNLNYTILTYDGRKHSVSSSSIISIIRQNGVDLAVVQFDSSSLYPVATLANYDPKDYSYVFAAGYPDIKNTEDSKYFFSGGFVLDREKGFLSVQGYNPATKNKGNFQTQATYGNGYELVYTSITWEGMSGGPIFDIQGRVIGIHGSADSYTDTEIGTIQIGNSLGIPITTFLRLSTNLKLSNDRLKIESNPAQPVTDSQKKEIVAGIVLARIPKGRASAQDLIKRGNLLYRQSRFDEALQAFNQAIVLNPKFVYLAYYEKGLILVMLGQNVESIKALEESVLRNSEFLPALADLSVLYRQSNQYNKALELIEKAIRSQPKGTVENPNLYNEKWGILDKLENYTEAIKAINKAISIAPHSLYYTNRGNTFVALKQYDKALLDYDKAIQLNPNLALAYMNRGSLYTVLKKYDKALADHNKAIQINSQSTNLSSNLGQTNVLSADDAMSYYNRGTAFYIQGNYKDAIADFDNAIKLNPELVEAYTNQAAAIISQKGDFNKAQALLTKAIQLDPQHASAYLNRGIVYYELGNQKKAIDDYDKTIQLSQSTYPEVYLNRGIAYVRIGNKINAIEDLEKSILLLQQRGRGDEIKDFLKEFEESVSIIQKEGRATEAKEYLQEIKRLQP
jgi:tetratricopeptide (TPR) repeat protein